MVKSILNFKAPVLAIAVITAGLLFPASINATGIPTVDGANLTVQYQQILNQMKQIEEYKRQIDTMTRQVNQQLRTVKALSGIRNWGDLANGEFLKAQRRFIPQEWKSTAGILQGDGGGVYSFGSAMGKVSALFGVADKKTLFSAPEQSSKAAAIYGEQRQAAAVAYASSETAYDGAGARVEILEKMLDQVNTTTDLKSSMDLNNRIAIERALIQNQQVQLLAVQLKMQAMDRLRALRKMNIRSKFLLSATSTK